MPLDIKSIGDLELNDDGWVFRLVRKRGGDYRRVLLGRAGECSDKVHPHERTDYADLLDYWRSLDRDARAEGLYDYHLAIGAKR